mmetsp:Transcript_9154/g.24706  ORF Transcript_9154/g.24706 Transcript_9154/m.24706 type:complete len:225 (-) Transcript_9154:227-901(-)
MDLLLPSHSPKRLEFARQQGALAGQRARECLCYCVFDQCGCDGAFRRNGRFEHEIVFAEQVASGLTPVFFRCALDEGNVNVYLAVIFWHGFGAFPRSHLQHHNRRGCSCTSPRATLRGGIPSTGTIRSISSDDVAPQGLQNGFREFGAHYLLQIGQAVIIVPAVGQRNAPLHHALHDTADARRVPCSVGGKRRALEESLRLLSLQQQPDEVWALRQHGHVLLAA